CRASVLVGCVIVWAPLTHGRFSSHPEYRSKELSAFGCRAGHGFSQVFKRKLIPASSKDSYRRHRPGIHEPRGPERVLLLPLSNRSSAPALPGCQDAHGSPGKAQVDEHYQKNPSFPDVPGPTAGHAEPWEDSEIG